MELFVKLVQQKLFYQLKLQINQATDIMTNTKRVALIPIVLHNNCFFELPEA